MPHISYNRQKEEEKRVNQKAKTTPRNFPLTSTTISGQLNGRKLFKKKINISP